MRIETSDRALASVAEDFGHVLRGSPAGRVRPHSPTEVAEVVREAGSLDYRLTLRGLGHSSGGQALPSHSIVVDLSGLDAVGPVDRGHRTIRCEAGAPLRDVVAATLEHGLLPRALTNLLDLSVGGLLSVGGIGPGSHRYGPLVANAAKLDVAADALEQHPDFLRILVVMAAQPPGTEQADIHRVVNRVREMALDRLRTQMEVVFGLDPNGPEADYLARFALAVFDGAFVAQQTNPERPLRFQLRHLPAALIAVRRDLA